MDATRRALPRLQHVTITFPPGEGAALRRFYTAAAGLAEKPVPRVIKPLGWIWFHTGDAGVELHCVPDDKLAAADSRHHFCLQVDDLAAARRRFEEAGCEIVEAQPLPLRPRFFTRDPFNNRIEVTQVEGDYLAAGEGAD